MAICGWARVSKGEAVVDYCDPLIARRIAVVADIVKADDRKAAMKVTLFVKEFMK